MKPMTIVSLLALALGSLSCAPDVQSVQIKYAMAGAIDAQCMVSKTETQLFGGGVDLDWTHRYLLALLVASNLEAEDWTSGGTTVHSKSRNDLYVEQVTVKYSGLEIPETTEAVSGTVEAGKALNFAVDALSPEAVTVLLQQPGKTVTVEVTLKGKFAHGGEYETAPFYFPLSIVRSGTSRPACTVDQTPTAIGDDEGTPPCSNWGQDGYYYYCKTGA